MGRSEQNGNRRLGGYDTKFCGKYGGDDTDFSKRYG